MRRYGQPAHKQTPEERLKELRERVHLVALKALLSKEDPDIRPGVIESNLGRLNKAVRDLTKEGHLYYLGEIEKKLYGSTSSRIHTYRTNTLEKYLEEYAALPVADGEATIRRHLKAAIRKSGTEYYHGSVSRELLDIAIVGWIRISKGLLPNLARAWVHRDEYLFMGVTKEDDPDGKPRPWEECEHPQYYISRSAFDALPKLLLRNAVEIYTSVMYDYLIGIDAGLKGWSYNTSLVVTLPNVEKVPPPITTWASSKPNAGIA